MASFHRTAVEAVPSPNHVCSTLAFRLLASLLLLSVMACGTLGLYLNGPLVQQSSTGDLPAPSDGSSTLPRQESDEDAVDGDVLPEPEGDTLKLATLFVAGALTKYTASALCSGKMSWGSLL